MIKRLYMNPSLVTFNNDMLPSGQHQHSTALSTTAASIPPPPAPRTQSYIAHGFAPQATSAPPPPPRPQVDPSQPCYERCSVCGHGITADEIFYICESCGQLSMCSKCCQQHPHDLQICRFKIAAGTTYNCETCSRKVDAGHECFSCYAFECLSCHSESEKPPGSHPHKAFTWIVSPFATVS